MENPDMSHAAIAAEIERLGLGRISRQRVSILLARVKKPTAIDPEPGLLPADHRKQFPASLTSGRQAAPAGNVESDSFVLFTVDMPAHLEAMLGDIVKRHPSLTIERVQDLATARLNGASRAGAWKTIGVDPNVGGEMVREDRDLRRVLQWAEGVNELRLAANATRIATGLSPNAVAALSFMLERQHDWTREATFRIEGEIEHRVGIEYLLADPRLIELENELEARRQQLEEAALRRLPVPETIEGEFVDVPPLLQDESLAS
jgi:hypothetical protein